jgi:lipopolysaccharide/colanic/teichoic acid biosynthesis glycosyltransferase
MIFKVNQFVLRAKQRIKMRVVILGKGKVDEVIAKTSNMEIKRVDQIQKLLEYPYIDEVIVSEEITDAKDLSLLLYMKQKLEIDILFTPSVYMNLLPERINGNSSIKLLNTFVGRRSDLDEYLIRMLDIVVILVISFIICPAMLVISFLIKMTSSGSIFYKQQRVGKDGEFFVLYKFRTMVSDAEKKMGFAPASKNDSRVTGIGKWLRRTRLDELPQLLNVIKGEMSLVGPRPENLYRVGEHKALQGLRLAVKPGLTGLAQVRSCYDLHPKHKVKYDYLYIQRRSFWLNINIMLKTIPAVFSKKGW